MKTLYIEAQKNIKLDEAKLAELERVLPDTIYIAYSIQYKGLAEQVRKKIKKKISGMSQALGCSEIKTDSDILLIGDGRFHALNIAFNADKETWIFNNYSIDKINREEIERLKKQEKAKYSRFLMSDKAGILVSIKPGQFNLDKAVKLRQKLKNKKSYIFLADNISEPELENFRLPVYINTACPGLEHDNAKIINCKKIENHPEPA